MDAMRSKKGKNFKYRMEFTRDHHETAIKSRIPEPFKRNYISFETTKKENLARNLFQKRRSTYVMQQSTQQFQVKEKMLQEFRDKFQIVLSPMEEVQISKQFDEVGMQLYLNKKLQEKRQFVSAATI